MPTRVSRSCRRYPLRRFPRSSGVRRPFAAPAIPPPIFASMTLCRDQSRSSRAKSSPARFSTRSNGIKASSFGLPAIVGFRFDLRSTRTALPSIMGCGEARRSRRRRQGGGDPPLRGKCRHSRGCCLASARKPVGYGKSWLFRGLNIQRGLVPREKRVFGRTPLMDCRETGNSCLAGEPI